MTETYITIGIVFLAFIVGNILGTRQFEKAQETLVEGHNLHREDMNQHYKDIQVIMNQHANLVTQLISELRNQPSGLNFPPPDTFEDHHPTPLEDDETPDLENADVAGGRI